jgi:hypothetical protein
VRSIKGNIAGKGDDQEENSKSSETKELAIKRKILQTERV